MQIDLLILKFGLLLFWSVWLTFVFLSNSFEALKLMRIAPESWKFASDNYSAIAKATSVYACPEWLNSLLFGGVIIWQGLAGLLYWITLANLIGSGRINLGLVNSAFAASLSLWAAFIIADEILKNYEGETSHLQIFIAQLLSLLALHIM
jgi:hypothetical protein